MSMFILFVLTTVASVRADCSDTVLGLGRLDTRNITYVSQSNSDQYITENWYSTNNSQGQYQMVDKTTIPTIIRCGATFPMYLNGIHPEISTIGEKEIPATVCRVTFFGDCTDELSIKIRKCDDIFQYYLPPSSSKSGYCFYLAVPAIDDKPDPKDVPKTVGVKPKLSYIPDGDILKPNLQFSCKFTQLKDDLFYQVDWYIKDKHINTKGPTNNVADLLLLEEEIIESGYGLGITILCQLRVAVSETGRLSDVVESGGFFAGVKVNNTVIQMQRDEVASIRIEPTVPIGCKINKAYEEQLDVLDESGLCFHDLQMFDPNATEEFTCTDATILTHAPLYKPETCGTQLQGTFRETDDNWTGSVSNFEVESTSVSYKDKNHFTFQLKTNELGQGHTIWQNYEIDYVTVNVLDDTKAKYKRCYANNDPHMRTADGENYEHQGSGMEGDFLLYRNTKYDISVQTKVMKCTGSRYPNALCTCAVTVRAGGDIFTINNCGATRFIGFPSCNENILDVKKIGNRIYRIYTPIGTYIETEITWTRLPFIHVSVYLSLKDYGVVEGLCGTFDGDKTNDFLHSDNTFTHSNVNNPNNFIKSWKVAAADNYLNPSNWNPPLYSQEYDLCVCKFTTITDPTVIATPEEHSRAICSKSVLKVCERNENFPKNAATVECRFEERKKKSIHFTKKLYQTEIIRKFNFGNIDGKASDDDRVRRQDDTDTFEIDEDKLKECNDTIMASFIATSTDNRLSMEDLIQSVNDCAYDYTATNDQSYITNHVDINNRIIENFNEKDIEYVTEHSEEVAAFESIACPKNCSGRGTCIAKECICDIGYDEDDCSVDISIGPNIVDVAFDGLCDSANIDTASCLEVQADNVMSGFKCKIAKRQRKIDDNIIEEEFEVDGEQIDVFTGGCPLPDSQTPIIEQTFVTEYHISISNDGINFGTGKTVYEFDSTCQEYMSDNAGNLMFEMKAGYCFIKGMCLPDAATKVNTNDCSRCSSLDNIYGWTSGCPIKPEQDSQNEGGSDTAVIIGAVIGSLFGVSMIIVTIIVVKKKFSKPKCIVKDSQDWGRASTNAGPFASKPQSAIGNGIGNTKLDTSNTGVSRPVSAVSNRVENIDFDFTDANFSRPGSAVSNRIGNIKFDMNEYDNYVIEDL